MLIQASIMSSNIAVREMERAARLENGGRLVKTFQQQVFTSRSKNEAQECRGDRIVVKSMSLPAGKRLLASLLRQNYLYLYLASNMAPMDADARSEFLAAKFEPTRFPQWAAPADCTVTQVTPATHMHRSRETIIETALCNIFSVTLKPVNLTAFVRAVRLRFELRLYEAFSWGPAGMFRPDIPASMKIRRIPVNEKKGEAGQCVFGRIVLVIVHHRVAESSHLVFTVSRGPYKQHPGGGCKVPSFLPGRTCVTWAPGVSFQDVEAWWQDIIHRPCLQLPSAVAEDCLDPEEIQFAEDHFVPQNPFTAGARMLKAALKPEYSDLRDDMKPFDSVSLTAEELKISDCELLSTPAQSLSSSDADVYFDE